MEEKSVSETLSLSDEMSEENLRKLLRMCEEDFDYLLNKICAKITKQDTFMRLAFTAKERFIITLYYLASGESIANFASMCGIAMSTIRLIIPEVCDCLIRTLKHYVKLPSRKSGWLQVAEEFEDKWQFPHAIGVVDARHVKIRKPPHSDNDYTNFRKFYSIVLLGIFDANANFMYVCAGGKGSLPDGGMFRHANYHTKFERNELHIPQPAVLDARQSVEIPYMLLGDKSFAFTEYCIRPFERFGGPDSPESKFNERLAKARTPAKIAFDGLYSRFKMLGTVIQLPPDKAIKMIMAAVYLYSFLTRRNTFEETVAEASKVPDSSHVLPRLQHKPANDVSRLMNIQQTIANYMVENALLDS